LFALGFGCRDIQLSMNFEGFELYPSYLRRDTMQPEELQVVGEILERFRLLEHLPPHNDLRVELSEEVPPGTPLCAAHRTWADHFFESVETPEGFPRQPNGTLCPPGLVQVWVDCIKQTIPGMGHHYGYDGYYLSLLISIPDQRIWDARGERTN